MKRAIKNVEGGAKLTEFERQVGALIEATASLIAGLVGLAQGEAHEVGDDRLRFHMKEIESSLGTSARALAEHMIEVASERGEELEECGYWLREGSEETGRRMRSFFQVATLLVLDFAAEFREAK